MPVRGRRLGALLDQAVQDEGPVRLRFLRLDHIALFVRLQHRSGRGRFEPAAAAAAAPTGQTGIASALTNTTKTIGGTFSSAVFGVVLAAAIRAFLPVESYQTWFGPTLVGLGLTVVAAVVFKVLGRHARTDRALTARETGFHH